MIYRRRRKLWTDAAVGRRRSSMRPVSSERLRTIELASESILRGVDPEVIERHRRRA